MCNRLWRSAARFLRATDRPTAVEDAVMLTPIVAGCIAAMTTLGNNTNSAFTGVGTTSGSTSS
jgi:Flp pilus assembly pilin Flp